MVYRLIALVVSCAVALTGCGATTPKVRNDAELDAAAILEKAIAAESVAKDSLFLGRD